MRLIVTGLASLPKKSVDGEVVLLNSLHYFLGVGRVRPQGESLDQNVLPLYFGIVKY